MTNSESITTKSDVAKSTYQDELTANKVYFLPMSDMYSAPDLTTHITAAEGVLTSIALAPDPSTESFLRVQLDTFDLHVPLLRYESNGHQDCEILSQAVVNCKTFTDLTRSLATETPWVQALTKIWEFFHLKAIFAVSSNDLWSPYDPALVKLRPKRRTLVRPKPDYALGLKWPSTSRMWEYTRNWATLASPSVSPNCTIELAYPFLVCESKSRAGGVRTAENQLGNAMVKSHDILCSLGLQHLHILGIAQVGEHVHIYMSFSTQKLGKGGEPFVDNIYLVEIATCNLTTLQGSLLFMRFIEYAKTYGATTFTKEVEAALTKAFLNVQLADDDN